jgi:hypothetical protein
MPGAGSTRLVAPLEHLCSNQAGTAFCRSGMNVYSDMGSLSR